jgi:hypothetical protein
VPTLKQGESVRVLVYFRNPLDIPVTLSFSGVESALEEQTKALTKAEQEMEQRKSDARVNAEVF